MALWRKWNQSVSYQHNNQHTVGKLSRNSISQQVLYPPDSTAMHQTPWFGSVHNCNRQCLLQQIPSIVFLQQSLLLVFDSRVSPIFHSPHPVFSLRNRFRLKVRERRYRFLPGTEESLLKFCSIKRETLAILHIFHVVMISQRCLQLMKYLILSMF